MKQLLLVAAVMVLVGCATSQTIQPGTYKVVLSVLVTEEGLPEDIRVEASSGIRSIDDRAIAQLKMSRFKPGTVGGKPAAVRYKAPINIVME